VEVDWAALLRERSATTTLLKDHSPVPMIAQRGTVDVLEGLRRAGRNRTAEDTGEGGTERVAVTGPVASSAVTPLTVGGQLMIHVEEDTAEGIARIGCELGLLPSGSGGDVLLLRSRHSTAFIGRRFLDGVPHVALTQLVLDSLSGPGRMPAEGERILEHLKVDETSWRLQDLNDWR
jgi:hypothetical protein